MVKIVVSKATAKNKKWKAVFFDDQGKKIKTTNFGDSRYKDYTQTGDKEKRRLYRERHRKDLKTGDYKRAGFLSYHILWGPTAKVSSNISSYKKRFSLK
tara:strand:- start:4105 stop:4401 length:297 start_codon:yes stop_codon:yes gene_type:complete